jgi:hypothetical protein
MGYVVFETTAPTHLQRVSRLGGGDKWSALLGRDGFVPEKPSVMKVPHNLPLPPELLVQEPLV